VDSTQLRRLVRPRRAGLLALVFFASYAYFYEGGGWNQNTRFDLVRAIVEHHTLQIDSYQENTGDKARMGEHYYTDKAPGTSLTAVPAVALLRTVLRALGADVEKPTTLVALYYVATLAASAVPAALASVCVYLIGLRLGGSSASAVMASIVCGLGTPLWPYATILYGHALAAGSLMAAFLGATLLRDVAPDRRISLGLFAGFAAAWAVVAEFPASVPATVIVAFAGWQCRKLERADAVRTMLAIGVGLFAGAIVLLAYNWLAFGAPLHVSYVSEAGSYEAMRTGIFGINWPTWANMRAILFDEYRGLLPLAPVLLFAPVGFWLLIWHRHTRAIGVTSALVAIFYILMTAGYAYWSGGWSYGSRHLGPALPFLCLGLVPVWGQGRAAVRTLMIVLAILGGAQSLIAVSTTPQPPNYVERPMRDLLWPAFRDGNFPIGSQSVLELRPASEPGIKGGPLQSWNLGQLLGWTAHASLLPLLVIWALAAWAWEYTAPRFTAP
jgi:hypothetical protein